MAILNNPDAAERNAYFPSLKSVASQARKTDYDGPTFSSDEKRNAGKILMIGTQERYLPLEGDILFSTGNHPVETLVPLLHLMGAGYTVDVATISGDIVKFEYWAFPDDDDNVQAIYTYLEPKFRKPLALADVIPEGLEKYDAVYLPGGHGAMVGLPESKLVQRVLEWAQDSGSTLIAICHGPAALAAGGLDGAINPFTGYELVAYPDKADKSAPESGYLPAPMQWYVAEALAAEGIAVLNNDVSGAVHRDRNLLSGDAPQAANELGKLAVEYLTDTKRS